MSKLGADFNASKPTEADFVRHPSKPNLATEIRFIRTRLKSFFGAMINLESGDFQDNIIPQAALVDHPNKPDSGNEFYSEVTVDSRGIVTSGSKETSFNAPRVFTASFANTGAVQEAADGLVRDPATNDAQWPVNRLPRAAAGTTTLPLVKEYRFFAPKNVTKIQVICIGGGLKGDASTTGAAAKVAWISFTVVPGEQYRILVGQSDAPSAFCTMDYARYVTSEGYTKSTTISGAGYIDKRQVHNFKRSPFRPFGSGGALNTPGTPGMVLLEWYA
jgi:hypothetical protein